jgi:hypothetical protein
MFLNTFQFSGVTKAFLHTLCENSEAVSLTQITLQRGVAVISKEVEIQFSRYPANVFTIPWLLMGQQTSPQLHKCVLFAHGIRPHTEVFQKRIDLHDQIDRTSFHYNLVVFRSITGI